MPYDPTLAEIRFGLGLSPNIAAPADSAAMLTGLLGPDSAAFAHPVPAYLAAHPSPGEFKEMIVARRTGGAAALRTYEAAQDSVRELMRSSFAAYLSRAIITPDGFRERLVSFWADHFTVRSKLAIMRHLVGPYVEEAIRPNITGRFADLLKAAVTHPMMLIYLDQVRSAGPGSMSARNGRRGLNENLAREVLELHTLGVGAPYVQADVRQLAELLTGLTFSPEKGFTFRHQQAEPGAETVLGHQYGGSGDAVLEDVYAVLDDLAAHPATAAHLARKIAVHFVSDTPDPGLVSALERAYLDTQGDLMAMYSTLLAHPASWEVEKAKVKPPFDFIRSALRALAVDPRQITSLSLRDLRRSYMAPMRVMGQPWETPTGPDGWPETAAAWITPQGMAGRISWAMDAAKLVDPTPDPREFVNVALGNDTPDALQFAARAAESRVDGVGIILASPAFQRR